MVTRSIYIIVLFVILPLTCQERGTTNRYDIRDKCNTAIRYIAILLFTIFLLYGIVSNILMAIVLFCRGQDNYYSHSFILIASQLIICDFIAFIPQMVVVLPELLQNKNSSYGRLFYSHTSDIIYFDLTQLNSKQFDTSPKKLPLLINNRWKIRFSFYINYISIILQQ